MSRSNVHRTSGRKSWLRQLIEAGTSEAMAKAHQFARKYQLTDWLTSRVNPHSGDTHAQITGIAVPQTLDTPCIGETATHNHTSVNLLAATPGGAGVAHGPASGNGDESTPQSKNPQLPVLGGAGSEDARCATLTSAGRDAAPCGHPIPGDVKGDGGEPVKPEDTLIGRMAWPKEGVAVVRRQCLNPNLVLVKLEDGREVSMWSRGRKWTAGVKVAVRLDKESGDPIYAPA